MKKLFIVFILFLVISCKKEQEEKSKRYREETPKANKNLGKELFEGKGMCASCHKENIKLIGPSIKEIAAIYTKNNANIAVFLQGESEPIVDPSQYEIMKANFAITKTLTEGELKALENYILSVK